MGNRMEKSEMLRSLIIGDVSYYPSEFIFGIDQGLMILGHWSTFVDIRHPIEIIRQKVQQVQPHVIWGQMLLWAPGGKTEELLQLCEECRKRGTKVVLHDGDAREKTRYPHDISHAIDLVLSNNKIDRSIWKVRQIRFPYFCFYQRKISARKVPGFECDLAFAGRLGGGIYEHRTEIVKTLKKRMGERFKVFPNKDCSHTLFRTPELAVSADSILGYGRPGRGWTDVRVFQYPGAGGVLLHDDAAEFLKPNVHYIPYKSGDIDSIMCAVVTAKKKGPRIRPEAFQFCQSHHSSIVRVLQVLDELKIDQE